MMVCRRKGVQGGIHELCDNEQPKAQPTRPAQPAGPLEGPAADSEGRGWGSWLACRLWRPHLLLRLRLLLLLLPWLRLWLCVRWRVSIEHVGQHADQAAQPWVHGEAGPNGEEVGHLHRRVRSATVTECCEHRSDCARRIRPHEADGLSQYACTPCAAVE